MSHAATKTAEKGTNVSFAIDDILKPAFCAASRVVGIDYYTMDGFDGNRISWDSFTLTSDEEGPFARWWIVNVYGRGAYYYTGIDKVPENVRFIKELSGLSRLDSQGDADLSSGVSALAVYEDGSGDLYAEEVFDDGSRIVFHGRPYRPSP